MIGLPYKTLIVKDFEEEIFDRTSEITENDIAFIISEAERIIYSWNGQHTSILKKYKAGTLSTKIKSQYQFYGFKTITVNQGEEKGALKEEVGRLLETGMHQMSLAETNPVEVVEPAAVAAPAPAGSMIANLLKFERPGLEPIPLNPLNTGNFGQAVPRINLPATGGKTPTPIIARMPEPANISRDMTGELHQLPRAEAGPVEVVEPAPSLHHLHPVR